MHFPPAYGASYNYRQKWQIGLRLDLWNQRARRLCLYIELNDIFAALSDVLTTQRFGQIWTEMQITLDSSKVGLSEEEIMGLCSLSSSKTTCSPHSMYHAERRANTNGSGKLVEDPKIGPIELHQRIHRTWPYTQHIELRTITDRSDQSYGFLHSCTSLKQESMRLCSISSPKECAHSTSDVLTIWSCRM